MIPKTNAEIAMNAGLNSLLQLRIMEILAEQETVMVAALYKAFPGYSDGGVHAGVNALVRLGYVAATMLPERRRKLDLTATGHTLTMSLNVEPVPA